MRLLIAEDERDLAEALSVFFEKNQFTVDTVYDGFDAYEYAVTGDYDAIVLDVMLPGMDGWEVLAKLRAESTVPVIMLTAKGDTFDRIQGLDLGADDYIVKPFDAKELLARIKAVLRRSSQPEEESERQVAFEGLTVSLDNYSVMLDGRQVEMPPKEIELLYFLASREGKVFTREQLLEQVWGFDFFGDSRTVDVHVKRIREKLGERDAWQIKTVWGVGYKFEAAK